MKTIVFTIILVCILSGCKVMYIPNAINVPLFNQKNEFKANIGINDFQAAYAVTNNIGLMANGYVKTSNFSDGSGSTGLNYSTSRNLFEGGIGYYKPLSEGFVFETYVGGGAGSLTFNGNDGSTSSGTSYKYSTNFNRFFIQPSIGYTHDIVDVAFSIRVARLGFNGVSTDYTSQMLIDNQINDLDKTNFFFMEPALTFRVGYKWGKFQTQILYSNKVNAEPLNYQKFCFNLSLHINISPRFKAKTQ